MRGRFCVEAIVGVGGFIPTNAIAAAANKSAPALAKRSTENKPFLLNECGVFMFLVELN